jgi:hypothetical protein
LIVSYGKFEHVQLGRRGMMLLESNHGSYSG